MATTKLHLLSSHSSINVIINLMFFFSRIRSDRMPGRAWCDWTRKKGISSRYLTKVLINKT